MRLTGTELDDVGPAMWAMRSAPLIVSGLEPATEPISLPTTGDSHRPALLF